MLPDKLTQVKELIAELQNCGYHSFQVKSIIKDTINSPLDKATEAELELLIGTLTDYINFAQKCRRV